LAAATDEGEGTAATDGAAEIGEPAGAAGLAGGAELDGGGVVLATVGPADDLTVRVIDTGEPGGPQVLSTQVVPLR
jgi:hypothetical protein